MTYEVHFQLADAQYTVRGPDIDGVLRLIQGVQGVGRVPEWIDWAGGDDGWIEWHGGDRPVAAHCEVEIGFRERYTAKGPAGNIKWEHFGRDSDIVRYRVCE